MECNCNQIFNDQIKRVFSLLEKHFDRSDEEHENIVNLIAQLDERCSDNFDKHISLFKGLLDGNKQHLKEMDGVVRNTDGKMVLLAQNYGKVMKEFTNKLFEVSDKVDLLLKK